MTLDGVIQAPGQADEDRTGGFQHGGRHMGYFDDLAQRWVVESVDKAGGFLHGRDHRDLRSSRGLTCRPGDGTEELKPRPSGPQSESPARIIPATRAAGSMTSGSSGPLATAGDRCCLCWTVATRTQRGPRSAELAQLAGLTSSEHRRQTAA
jgi:hypothetical protein